MKKSSVVAIAIIVAALLALFLVPIKYIARLGGIMNYTTMIVAIIVGAICGMVTQGIMTPKGYSERASFAVGLFLSVVGIIIACVLPPKDGYASTTTSTESDKAKALREYKALLDEGAISKSEFDAKKRELLG